MPLPTSTHTLRVAATGRNFFGKGSAGINREVASMVEVSQRCRQKKVKSLAPTHRGVLSLGLYIQAEFSRLQPNATRVTELINQARGILPSVKYIAEGEAASFAAAHAAAQGRRVIQNGGEFRGHALTQKQTPDIQVNPLDSSIDARGNGRYRRARASCGGSTGCALHFSCVHCLVFLLIIPIY